LFAPGTIPWPQSANGKPGRCVIAWFDSQFPRARRRMPYVAPAPPPPPEPPEPTALPEGFATDPQRCEEDVRALEQLIQARSRRIDALLQSEHARLAALPEHFAPLLWDGSAPLSEAERAAMARLLARQEQILGILEAPAGPAELAPLPPLRTDGPIQIVEHSGHWRDHWVGATYQAKLKATAP